jgi:hypothetical protein
MSSKILNQVRVAASIANGIQLTSFYELSMYTVRASSIEISSLITFALGEKEAT